MSNLEYHMLLALANGPLHGYALKDALTTESDGTLTPFPATLYRALARLLAAGLVTEVEPNVAPPPHPGLPRRYFDLTAEGRRALSTEAQRLKAAVRLAEARLRAKESHS
jgi:DNA-binding PadR family transcriptional regulator